MTHQPNNASHRENLPFILILLVPLVGLFLLALATEVSFFFIIAAALFGILCVLVPAQLRFNRNQAAFDLQLQDISERINLIDFSLQKEDRTIRSFEDKIVDFSNLKRLTENLIMCLTLDETTQALSDEVRALLGDEDSTVILYLFHSKTGELGISSSHKGELKVNIKNKKGDEFDEYLAKTMRPLIIEDVKSDYRFDIEKIKVGGSRSIMSLISVPMAVESKSLGILRIDSSVPQKFDTQDLRFLTTMGDLGAIAIENAQLYNHVQQLAIRDGLTGLYLRRYLMERLGQELSRHLSNGNEMSFVMIDIDKFKAYNDKFGHMAGDIVLKTVGSLLYEFFDQPGQLVSRYGGEEFAVLLADCSKEKAAELADELRKLVEMKMVILRREKTKITVSIGVAVFPGDAKMQDELIHKADQALYRAKEFGRNQVCLA